MMSLDVGRCPACFTNHMLGAPCHKWPVTIPKYPAPTSDTLGEAEARRQGYEKGVLSLDELRRQDKARIEELEAILSRTTASAAEHFAAGRRAALEEAARVCDGSAAPENTRWVLQRAAAAIRALAEQEPQG